MPSRGEGENQADALRAELQRLELEHAQALTAERHARELAEAEAGQLRERLTARVERIEDLQQALWGPGAAVGAGGDPSAGPTPIGPDRAQPSKVCLRVSRRGRPFLP
jgi:hypothetical protein